MQVISPILLGLGLLLPFAEPRRPAEPDPALLQEMLHDRQHPRGQCQAALLLVQDRSAEAEKIVRQGLLQTDDVDLFLALATALRTAQDSRFIDELVAALAVNRPGIRPVAAEALAVMADVKLVEKLRIVVEDGKGDLALRQAALWTLGRTGLKASVTVLVQQLDSDSDLLRRTAAEALVELSGQDFGVDKEKWQSWWDRYKNQSNERWLELRLAYQTSRARRLDSDLERARGQVLRLHQQLYNRLPPAERLAYVQSLLDQDDVAVRGLAVTWGLELLPGSDAARQKQIAQVLLKLSQDSSLDVQRAATLALGRITDGSAFERLRLLLRQGRPPVRAAAARSLAALARGTDADAKAKQKEVVPLLQKALDDAALEVVAEAAEDLGALGVAEAGPVLLGLLRHPSESVRQTAAQALERVADVTVLNGLLDALDDPSVTVRFSLIGAVAHAAADTDAATEEQRKRLLVKLEALLLRDADPGVRSRAATVLGEVGPASLLSTLWRCVLAGEEGRVQDKAWTAMLEIIGRSNSLSLLQEWDRTLTSTKQGTRRVQLLTDAAARWSKRSETKAIADGALELLIKAYLEHGKWSAAFPLVRELLTRLTSEAESNQRLHWLLTIGELALADGNKIEAQHVVQEASAYVPKTGELAEAFEKLAKQVGEK
jgi:HEAT repeat protein